MDWEGLPHSDGEESDGQDNDLAFVSSANNQLRTNKIPKRANQGDFQRAQNEYYASIGK